MADDEREAIGDGFVRSHKISEEELEELRKSRGRVRSRTQSPPQPRDFSWEDPIETPDYSPDEFYVGASDDYGSTNVQCRFPAAIHDQMMALIQQRRVPAFRTIQDLIRDAVQHRLFYISQHYELPPAMTRLLASERMLSSARTAENLKEAQEAAVENTRNILADLARVGEHDGLRRLLADAWKNVGSLAEPYQTQLRQVLSVYGPEPAVRPHHEDPYDWRDEHVDGGPPPFWEQDR